MRPPSCGRCSTCRRRRREAHSGSGTPLSPAAPDPLDAWAALAALDAPVAGGRGLHLPGAAVLLANAVWRPDPERFAEAAAWCEARGVPDAVVVDGGDARRRAAAVAAGYRRTAVFEAIPLTPAAPVGAGRPADLVVEQAAFGQAHAAGLLLAQRYRQPQNAVPIAGALADALRREARLALWLAYRGDDPVGALLAHRGEAFWSGLLQAGEADARRALGARLADAAAAEGARALRWSARGGHGALPARGLVRLERPPPGDAERSRKTHRTPSTAAVE